MTRINLKLFLCIKIFLIFSIILFESSAADYKSQKNMIAIGSHDAIVKIKIFSSLTCPHCAQFHKEVIPKIKKNYVKTGKVQLIFIDFPLDLAAFNASKLLHCLDQKMQIEYLDTIYEKQEEWIKGSDIKEINSNLKKMVKNLGISSDTFDKCLTDEVISDKILNGRINGQKEYSINSTPTIIINEKKLKGSVDFNNIKRKIEKLI